MNSFFVFFVFLFFFVIFVLIFVSAAALFLVRNTFNIEEEDLRRERRRERL